MLVQAASAADMPAKAPVYKAPIAAPVYNWTGLYVGGVAGYGWLCRPLRRHSRPRGVRGP